MKLAKQLLFIIALLFFVNSIIGQTYQASDSLALINIDIRCDAAGNLNWNTETDPGSWTGVTWSDDDPKRVSAIDVHDLMLTDTLDASSFDSIQYLEVYWNQLNSITLGYHSRLILFACGLNLLTELDLTGAPNLSTIWCNDNNLETFDISGLESINDLHNYGNKLPFSQLVKGLGIPTYEYSWQQDLYSYREFDKDTLLDYSDEAIINDSITTFIFYKDYQPVDTNNTGFFQTQGLGRYFCNMKNTLFPGTTLSTSITKIVEPKFLDISKTELYLLSTANSKDSFDIATNLAWEITIQDSWLSADILLGEGNRKVGLLAEANTDTLERTTIITITAENLPDQQIIVTQQGKAYLEVSPGEITLGAEEGSTDSLLILTNRIWEISIQDTWLTADTIWGDSIRTVQLVAEANQQTDERTTILTITSEDIPPQQITVNQAGISNLSLNSNASTGFTIYPNPSSGIVTLFLPGNSGSYRIKVLDSSGQVLVDECYLNLNNVSLDLRNLNQGLYFIQVIYNDQILCRKLLIE